MHTPTKINTEVLIIYTAWTAIADGGINKWLISLQDDIYTLQFYPLLTYSQLHKFKTNIVIIGRVSNFSRA